LDLPLNISSVKGFLDPAEGEALHKTVLALEVLGPCVEIGSYCGKSAVYLGTACQKGQRVLFTVDHHRGSEENQPGWEYHDTTLWDDSISAIETLPFLRQTLREADLEDCVIPVVGRSHIIARAWATPIAFLFIDGGHTMGAATADYEGWTPHLRKAGVLAIHDVFPNPDDGGRPPYEIYKIALESGRFEELASIKSLRLLRCLSGDGR
jgi:predicted O-methyltransferase YrrM